MSTVIRADISAKNPYWISRHRYYELKHFCLQYPLWQKQLKELSYPLAGNTDIPTVNGSNDLRNPTAERAEKRSFYQERIGMIERTAKCAADDLSDYILKAVTQETSFTALQTQYDIPCCKDTYYELYRKFFWLLSQERQ